MTIAKKVLRSTRDHWPTALILAAIWLLAVKSPPRLPAAATAALIASGAVNLVWFKRGEEAVKTWRLTQSDWEIYKAAKPTEHPSLVGLARLQANMKAAEQAALAANPVPGKNFFGLYVPSQDKGQVLNASSSRHGASWQLRLGSGTLLGSPTACEAVIEHEVAHLDRYDTRRRRLLLAVAAGAIAAPLAIREVAAAAAATLVGLLVGVLHNWWTEVQCDREAARKCGRDAVKEGLALAGSSSRLSGTHPPRPLRLCILRR
jgi:Zn-dependent protease with chaperone function